MCAARRSVGVGREDGEESVRVSVGAVGDGDDDGLVMSR